MKKQPKEQVGIRLSPATIKEVKEVINSNPLYRNMSHLIEVAVIAFLSRQKENQ
jgi:hypothetical protein